MSRGKVTDARCGPPGDCLDVMRQTIITVGGMEAGYGHDMFEEMVGQIAAAQLLVAPLLQRYINVGDGLTERVGKLRGHASHVLRSRPGQFVNLADMSGWIRQDDCDHFRHIPSVGRRGPSGAERQPDRAVLGNRLGSPVGEEGVLEKDCRPDLHDGQSGPVQHLLAEPMLLLLGESVISVRLICDTVSWEMLTNTSRSRCSRATAAAVTVASR